MSPAPRRVPAAAPQRATPSPAAGDAGGDRFGPYELFELLGRGAATEVRRARHVDHPHVDLALKLVPDGNADAAEAVAAAFRREAALLASIGHGCLPTIHDVGALEGRPYLAMEHIPGRSLAAVLRDGPLSEVALLALASDVAHVLAAVHRHGVVHRDIKPQNLIVTPAGRTRVVDVGLATWAGAAVTAADPLAGTFVYSAPEQTGMFARAVDGRADLYSLGVVLYECATGSPPFTAPDVAELLHQHAFQAPADLGHLRPDLPPALVDLVGRLLAKDADDRVDDADALAAELRSLRGEDREPAAVRAATATPLGRDAELRQLRSRWRGTERDGALVVVSGEPGSGSGTLLRTLATEARAAGGAAAVGRCTLDPTPLGPFRAALRSHLDAIAAAPEDARRAATERLRVAVADTSPILRALVPSLAEVLDPGGAPVRTAGATREEDVVLAVVDLVRGLAREEGRFLLALTDAQWLDPLSLRVVRELATTLRGTALLLVVTARPGARDHLAAILAEVDTDGSGVLELGPLDPSAAAALVANALAGAEVPEELVASVLTRTGGNPAAVAEYVRALVDAGAVRPCWGRWELDRAALERLQLPSDVRELVLTRLDRSDADVRALLTAAAVQGAGFDEDLLGRTTGRDPVEVRAALAAAGSARLVEASGEGFRFVHEGVRLALLEGAEEEQVAATHAAIAAALEVMPAAPDAVRRIAHHRVAAGIERDPTAAYRACLRAAEDALGRQLASDAVALLEHARRAAELAAITPDADFEHTCGRAAFLTGAYARARDHLQRAVAGSSGRVERARAYETLARIQASDHDADGALRTVRRGLDALDRPLPRRRLVLVLTSLVRLLVGTVRLRSRRGPASGHRRVVDEVEASLLAVAAGAAAGSLQNGLVAVFHARGLAPASRLPRCDVRSSALAGLALVAHHVRLERTARRLFAVAIEEARAVGSPRAIARVRTTEAVAATRDGDAAPLAAALEQHGRWLDLGEYVPWVILTAALYHGDGHALRAETWVRRARRRVSDDPAPTDEAGTLLMEIAVAATRGRIASAAIAYEELRAARATLPPTRDTQLFYAWTELVLANEQEDTGPAVDHAVAQLETFGLPRGNVTAGWVRMSIATALLNRAVHRRGGERRALLRGAARELRAARRGGSPHLRPMLDTVAARRALLLGRGRRADHLLDRASRVARQLDQPLVLHEVAVVRARRLRDSGYAPGARRQARVALALAVENGWELRAQRVRTEFDLDDEFAPRPHGSQPSTAGVTAHDLGELQAARRLEALQEVSAAASSVLDPREVTRIALDVVLRMLSAERAFLFTVDPDEGRLVPRGGRDAEGGVLRELRGYSASLVERVHTTGEAIVVTGTEEGEALGSRSAVAHGLRSILIAPIEIGGRRSGVLYLDSRVAKGIFTADDLGLLATVAGQVAAAQETARAAQLEVHVEAARRQRDLADRLRASMAHLAATLEPDEVLRRGLALTVDACAGTRGCLLRPSPDGWRIVTTVRRDAAGAVTPVPGDAPVLAGDVRGLLSPGRPRVGGADEPVPAEVRRQLGDPALWLVVPLHADGTWQGLLVVATSGPTTTEEVAVEVAATLSQQTLAAHQTAELFAEVQRLATHDTLTGLENRGRFWHLAEQHLASTGPSGTAIMLDVDHFKAVNDTHGHGAGDAVLREVAGRLLAAAGDGAVLARYGGEEFAAFLPGTDDGAALAERMRAAVAASPVATEAGPVPVTISAGCSRVGADGDLDAAMSRADGALYRAKRRGRDRVAVDDTVVS